MPSEAEAEAEAEKEAQVVTVVVASGIAATCPSFFCGSMRQVWSIVHVVYWIIRTQRLYPSQRLKLPPMTCP